MDRLSEKLRNLIISACEQFLVASVQAFHAIVFALLTIPESVSSVTSLGELAWDQVSSPGPHAPAGNLTFRLIKIWTNHVVEIELPRLRNLAAHFDWKFALSLHALEWRCASLAKPLLVDRVLVRLNRRPNVNRQDGIAFGPYAHDRGSLRIACAVHSKAGLSYLIPDAYERKIAVLPDVEAVAAQTGPGPPRPYFCSTLISDPVVASPQPVG